MTNEVIDRQIDDIILECFSPIGKEWEKKHAISNIPEGLLFHYTDAAGLLGIIGENKLRSTHALFLNDPSELRHALKLTQEIVDTVSKNIGDQLIKDILDTHLLDWISDNLSFFVTCFCEDGDLLSQWKGYGAGGGGYSLGFDAATLSSAEICHPGIGLQSRRVLRRVIYDNNEKKEFIHRILDSIKKVIEYIKGMPGAGDDKIVKNNLRYKFLDAVVGYAICFKNVSYRGESEWRLCTNIFHGGSLAISPLAAGSNFSYLARGGNIVPYIQIEPKCRREEHGLWPYVADENSTPPEAKTKQAVLPIKKIFIGPHADHTLNAKAIEWLLNKNLIYDVAIIESSVPSRRLF